MRKIKLDILGSCISRVALLNGNYKEKGVYDERMEVQYFFDKNNIVSSMMPPPFSRDEVESINENEMYDKSRIRSLKQGINKDTIDMMLEGNAEYLIIDVYDLSVSISCYKNTTFSNCAFEFYRTSLYKKYINEVGSFNFMDIPTFLWYPYIDLFFEKIKEKFDNDHIILNTFHSCRNYIDTDGKIKEIPETYLMPFHGNYKYNDKVRDVEDYIISKINPYVIDLSKYFIVDENYWHNINGVHYQKLYYEETLKAIENILFNINPKRVYNNISSLTTAKILNLDMADEKEYLKYFKEIKSPFVSCEILDNICRIFTNEEIVKNRKFLGELYKISNSLEDKLIEEDVKNEDKIKLLLENISHSFKEEYKDFAHFIQNFYKEDKSEAVKYLENIFLEMLNKGDMNWTSFLENIEKYAPHDKRILSYRLQYFQAINDVEKIKEYEKLIK